MIFVYTLAWSVDHGYRTERKIGPDTGEYNNQMAKTHLGLAKTHRRSKPSAAARRLIEAAKSLLDTRTPSEITTKMLLDEASVARNTLYLHFEDHTALLEIALLEIFTGGVKEHLALLTESLSKATGKNDFMRRIGQVIEISQDRKRRSFRITRCRLIAHSDKNPRFSALLANEQARINKSYMTFFIEIRRRGWMGNNITPDVAAVVVQALTLGRVIDDVAADRLPQAAWNDAFMTIIKEVILGR